MRGPPRGVHSVRPPYPHREHASTRAGFPAVSPPALPNCEAKGYAAVTQDTEHDEGDEPTETPVTPSEPTDEELDDDEHREPETPPDEQPEASAPKSEKEIERALRRVEQAGTTYRNAVSRAMGEDANDLLPCPRCNAPVAGMVFPPTIAPVDDETREAVLVSLGIGDGGGSHLNDAKGVHECEACSGFGLLAFPTKVPHVKEQQCPACTGSGYVLDQQREAVPLYAAPAPNVTAAAVEPTIPPCPTCGMAGMAGVPHFCNPVAASG